MRRHSWILTVGLMLSPILSQAGTVVVPAVRDATLIESPGGSLANGQGPYLFCGRTGQSAGSIRRTLVAFDVAAHLPPGATVNAVRLEMHVSQAQEGSVVLSLHRLLATWGEGASSAAGGSGAPAQIGDATWQHRFYDLVSWEEPGGDFAPLPSAIGSGDSPGSYSLGSTSQMVADVQAWLEEPATNHGWILLGDETRASTVKRFDSRESSDPALQPQLVVEFGRGLGACSDDGLDAAAQALCAAYCEQLDCDGAPGPARARSCETLAERFARATGGLRLPCEIPDADLDGIEDGQDVCPGVPDPEQLDADLDGAGDLCDNCPTEPNPDQQDSFGIPGRGDACECPCFGTGDVTALLVALRDRTIYTEPVCIDTRANAKPLTALTIRRIDAAPCGVASADCSALAVEFTEDNLCQLNPAAPEPDLSIQGISDAQRTVCRAEILSAAASAGIGCN